jgi:uncharacterized phiE125 gp8 family phage protein
MMHIQRLSRDDTPPVLLDTVKLFIRVTGNDEDDIISQMTIAAARELEESAEIALLFQTVRITLDAWPVDNRLRLPIGPILAAEPEFTVTSDGATIAAEILTGLRPVLILPEPATEAQRLSRLVIEYQAGFGSSMQALPPDIPHAICDQVATLYDFRGANAHEGKAPAARGAAGQCYALQRVIGRYRGVRLA